RLLAAENPRRIDAGQAIGVGEIGTVAEQSTSPCELSSLMARWYGVAASELSHLLHIADEDWADADNERGPLQISNSGKGRFDFIKRACLKHLNSDSEQCSCLFRVANDRLRSCNARVDQ